MEPPTLLRTITDLLITFTDRYKTLWKPPTLLRTITDYCKTSRTVTDPLITFTDHYRTSPTCYVLYYIYNIVDITKQISKGQKKWS